MIKISVLLAALGFAASVSAEPVLRIAGSTTVKGALEHNLPELEAAYAGPIEFSASGSNSGVVSLLAGTADMAMTATPLPEIAKMLNERSPGAVDVSALNVEPIGKARITFIVNPRNPVRRLNSTQLAQILTGRIKNWREVGGADQTILVVSLANSSSLLLDKLTAAVPLAADARRVPNATQISPVVSLEPGAIGIISTAHVRGKTSLIETDAAVETPLFLVTRGAPTGAQRKLIEAARELLKDRG